MYSRSNDEFNVEEKIVVEMKLGVEDNVTLNVPQSECQESPTLLSDSVNQTDFKEDSENYNENKEIIKDLEFEISSNFENDYSDIKNNSLQNQNTYSNLNKCKTFVSDICILCDTFHEDLMLHCAKSHGCITYIPICQTDSFIHYTNERTGNVLHSYSDLLYGNPYYICKCCGIFLKNMDSVRLHMNIHTNLYMIQSSQSCFCSGKTFIFPQHKFKALLLQSNYTCSNCSYIFSCEKGLLLHLKVVHFNKSICSVCGEKDITNDDCIMLHNTNHLNERNEKICETDDNVEQIWDQTHYSWNALDNHLNYFDGKINRLTHVNDLNNSDITRQHLSLPIRVDPDYATLPENLCISPTVSMVKYTKMKLDCRLTNSAADSYASKELDMNIQYLLRKKFIGKGRKRKSSPLSQKIKKRVSLASCLELKKLQSRKRNEDDDDNIENLPTRRKYARRAKTRVKRKDKLQKVNDNENIMLSRTRSGMRPKDATDFAGEEEEIQLPSTGNEFSGEWVNDHTFVCCSCGAAFLDLAEVMDHKWESHPGVWCAHTMIQGQDKVPKIFCEQYLPPHSRETNKKSASKKSKPKEKLFQKKNLICTHCKLKFENKETFHFHVIDCGGINQIIINKKKQKKGMRFRRRKGQGVPSRRYPNNRNSGINSAAISSKRSAERGTGMPSGNENNPSQKAQTSSSISKRNLKFALTSNKGINRNIKVSSSRLKNILSSRKRGEFVQRSNKRNLRRLRLRKRKVEVNDNSKRVTRNSGASFVEKTDSSLNEKRKRLPQRSVQIPEKNVGSKKEKESSSSKGNERKSVKSKSNFEEMNNRENENKENAKIDIKNTTTNCIQNAIKKLVPLSKKFGPKAHLQRKCDDNLESSHHTHVNKKKLKFTRKTLEAIEMLRNHVSKQKRKFKDKVNQNKKLTQCRNSKSLTDVKNKESIRKDNDSDSASEPEVIRNFREKRVFGRRGLRSKKSHLPRYSLRPSISLNNQEEEANVINEKEEEGDEEEELIVKPRIGKKRKYNIGDDDEAMDDTQNNKLLSTTKESNNRSTVNNNTKKRRRSVAATSESESQPVVKKQTNDTFDSKGLKSGKVLSRRKSLPTFKNTDSKISRFYYMAHKKFSRLKLLCQNTDSETSSFEGFCPSPKKIVRRWSTENADISMISTLDTTSSKNCSTPVPKISKSRAPRMNKLKSKKRKECSKNVCKTNRKISRSVKHRKRKFLTPATVDSDSDSLSDVPLIDRKKKVNYYIMSAKNTETDDASCERKEMDKSENIDVKHDIGSKSLPETSNSSLSDVSHRKAAECKKRSSEGQESKKKRCRVIKKTDSESLSEVPSSVRNKRKKNIGQKLPPSVSDSNDVGPIDISHTVDVIPCDEVPILKKKVQSKSTKKKKAKEAEIATAECSSVFPKYMHSKASDVEENQVLDLKGDSGFVENENKIKIKPKRKYTFKKKLSNSIDDDRGLKSKMKKNVKEVRVLSYKSLNTKDGVAPINGKISEGEMGEELKKKTTKTKRSYVRRNRKKIDENSPAVTKLKSDLPPLDVSTENEDGIGFLCTDCGLSFDSALSREDHRQDCRNIAFEMSLMAEDYLYECPYCQLTFALKGTQRKHITSCRLGRSRKNGQRKKKAANKSCSKKKSSCTSSPKIMENCTTIQDIPLQPAPEGVVENETPTEIGVIGNHLASCCQKQTGVTEICSLLLKYKLCTNGLRCFLNSSLPISDTKHTVINVNAESPFSSYTQGFSYKVLQNLMTESNDLLNHLETVSDALILPGANDKQEVSLSITRPDLFKALSQVEEALKKAVDLDSLQKRDRMLSGMKQMFQSDTGS